MFVTLIKMRWSFGKGIMIDKVGVLVMVSILHRQTDRQTDLKPYQKFLGLTRRVF